VNYVGLFGEEVDTHRLLHRLYSAEHVLDCAVMAILLTGAKHPNSTLSLTQDMLSDMSSSKLGNLITTNAVHRLAHGSCHTVVAAPRRIFSETRTTSVIVCHLSCFNPYLRRFFNTLPDPGENRSYEKLLPCSRPVERDIPQFHPSGRLPDLRGLLPIARCAAALGFVQATGQLKSPQKFSS
jgi:hypothetical protein